MHLWNMSITQINPFIAILAETLLSLNHYNTHVKRSLRCCIPLMYLWIVNHIKTPRYILITFSGLILGH